MIRYTTEFYNLRLVLERKASIKLSESSWLEFSEKFSTINLVITLNSLGIAHLLFLKTLVVVQQNLQELHFLEVIKFLILLAVAISSDLETFWWWGVLSLGLI